MDATPTYLTANKLADTVGKHRAVVMRLLAQRQIEPDAFVDLGNLQQPIFRPEVAIQIASLLTGREPLPVESIPQVIA